MVACFALALTAAPAGTHARFTGTRAGTANAFRGAVFSVSTAPTVTVTRSRGVTRVSWTAVTVTGSATVNYRVMRVPTSGASVQVCTGVDVPTVSSGTASCTDTVSGANAADKYTEQPYVAYLGSMTWSLAASTPA